MNKGRTKEVDASGMKLLHRQSSSLSSNGSNESTASTALLSSSWADISFDGSQDGSSLKTSIVNLIISLVIFVVGFWFNHYLVPSHEHIYTRSHPYQTTSRGDVILNSEWNHPHVHPASVPSALLKQTCVCIPLVLLVLVHRFTSSYNHNGAASWNCTLSSITGLLTGLGMTELLTHMLKYYVARRRPNFYALCQFDGETCTADATKILESQLSFPSGHSSMSWCGMTFLVLVLLGRFQLLVAQRQQSSSSLAAQWRPWTLWLVCLVPWSWSAYVATSRIVDNWHHASDVLAGTALGIACATLSYHSVFPHVLSTQAGTSYTELVAQKNY